MKTKIRTPRFFSRWLSAGPVGVLNGIGVGVSVILLITNPLALPWGTPQAGWSALILMGTAALAVFTAPRLPWVSAVLVVAALAPQALEWTWPMQGGGDIAGLAMILLAFTLQTASRHATALSRVVSLVAASATAMLLSFITLWRAQDFLNAQYLSENPEGFTTRVYPEDDVDQTGPSRLETFDPGSGQDSWLTNGPYVAAHFMLLFGLCLALGYAIHAAQRRFDARQGWRSLRPSVPQAFFAAVAALVVFNVLMSDAYTSGNPGQFVSIVAVGVGALVVFRRPRAGLCIVAAALLIALITSWPIGWVVEPIQIGWPSLLALAVAAATLPRGRAWWWWIGSAAGVFALWMGCGVTRFNLADLLRLTTPGPEGDTFSIYSFVVATLSSLLIAAVAVALGFSAQLWMRYRASRAQLAAAKQELEVSEERRALADERRSIAGDVHDVLAHSLTVIVAQGEGALVSGNHERDTAVRNMVEVARASLRDVRALIERLDGEDTDLPSPGLGDLPALIETFRSAGLPVELREFGERTPLGDANQLAVFRIAQESLTNSLKHGGRGANAVLTLDWRGSESGLALTLASTIGTVLEPAPGNGMGIEGMRTRAAVAGGWLSAGPTTREDSADHSGEEAVEAADGWLVTAQIPAAKELAEVLR